MLIVFQIDPILDEIKKLQFATLSISELNRRNQVKTENKQEPENGHIFQAKKLDCLWINFNKRKIHLK